MKIVHFLAKNSFIVTISIVLIVMGVLHLFGIRKYWLFVALPLTFLLSPKEKEIETQSGKKTLITWFLLKEPITLDK